LPRDTFLDARAAVGLRVIAHGLGVAKDGEESRYVDRRKLAEPQARGFEERHS